jgi:hypothetical protein
MTVAVGFVATVVGIAIVVSAISVGQNKDNQPTTPAPSTTPARNQAPSSATVPSHAGASYYMAANGSYAVAISWWPDGSPTGAGQPIAGYVATAACGKHPTGLAFTGSATSSYIDFTLNGALGELAPVGDGDYTLGIATRRITVAPSTPAQFVQVWPSLVCGSAPVNNLGGMPTSNVGY